MTWPCDECINGGIMYVCDQDTCDKIKAYKERSKAMSLDVGDIAEAIAIWAKVKGYQVYSCGTEALPDGRIAVEAEVRKG